MRTASVVAGCCFLVFMVGSQVAFSRKRETTRHLLLLSVAAPLAAVAEVVRIATAAPSPRLRYVVAMALFLASLSLFAWAAHTTRTEKFTVAFSTDLPHALVDRGPYGLVRHPFYLAYLSAYTAGFVVSADRSLILVIVAMGALYGYAAVVEERKFQGSELRSAYATYTADTRMFLPLPRRETPEHWFLR